MTPTDDPDIVPLTDDDCSNLAWGYWMVGYGNDAPDHLKTWSNPPDTLDTDGDPE